MFLGHFWINAASAETELRANPTAFSSQIKLHAVVRRKLFFTSLSMTPSSLFLNRFTVQNTSLQMSTDSLMYFDVPSLRHLKLPACSLKNISAYILEKDQASWLFSRDSTFLHNCTCISLNNPVLLLLTKTEIIKNYFREFKYVNIIVNLLFKKNKQI